MRVMDAMCDNPIDWPTLKRKCAANGQKVLQPPWRLVATMSQKSVKPHADPQAGGNPPQQDRSKQRLPTEHEECGQRSSMKQPHENCCMPINAFRHLVNHRLVLHFSNRPSSSIGSRGCK